VRIGSELVFFEVAESVVVGIGGSVTAVGRVETVQHLPLSRDAVVVAIVEHGVVGHEGIQSVGQFPAVGEEIAIAVGVVGIGARVSFLGEGEAVAVGIGETIGGIV